MAPHVLQLTGKGSAPQDVTLVYLGTPSYDLPDKCLAQTSHYTTLGCTVISLNVATEAPTTDRMQEVIDMADILLVSGGNTSFAMRRWKHLGLDCMIREACLGERRVVMAGGSAGAICWWSGGHSDSLDPDSYKQAKLHPHEGSHHSSGDIEEEDNKHPIEKEEPDHDEEAHEWDYIRVNGLGFVPGLCCPHHDRVQSNGILRATDFDAMMLRHPTEVGICIDHNAAFLIERDTFKVVCPVPGDNDDGGGGGEKSFPGSVMQDGSFSGERCGTPGVWIKEVVECGTMVKCWQCPPVGRVCDLLKVPEYIRQSTRHLVQAAKLNPDDGLLRMSYPGFTSKSFFGGNVAQSIMDNMAEGDDDDDDDEEKK